MEKKYYVDFGTGAGNDFAETLEKAMEFAVDGARYTQQSIKIFCDEDQVAELPWWGVAAEEDDIVTVNYGDFGYYGEWIMF